MKLVVARWFVCLALVTASPAFANVTVPFVEDWPGTSVQLWGSNAQISNPGTGGTLGVGDGFLRVARTNGQLGVKSNSLDYFGDWLAADVGRIFLSLNDIESNEALAIHVSIGNAGNLWQYNLGFAPAENAWSQFDVSLADSTLFTHIIAADGLGFAAAIQNADRLLIRHDAPPFDQFPPNITGQFGIDHLVIWGAAVGVEGPLAGTGQPVWLAPPYPNPSRGAVACAVETNDAGPLRFSIVDVRGRVVRTASLEGSAPGRRLWMWDGLDASGARVAAGVYRVRVVGPAGGTTRSVVRVD